MKRVNFAYLLQFLKTITNHNSNNLMKYITFLFLFIAQLSFAQSESLTKVIDRIDVESDTLQAVFDWVTDNIKYDVGKLKDIEKGVSFYKKGKYKNTIEYKAAMLEKVIKRKKGVCDDYTLLFDAIVSELGYSSFIVEGITKNKKGKVRKSSSHSWNAVKVNGNWKLYDPTWGAGYVNDKRKFVKKYNDQWYGVSAEKIIETHFPFDPIWQLSEHPMTYSEYEKGEQTEKMETPYDFANMIDVYLAKDEKGRKTATLERSELNGGNIKALKKYRKYLQKKINYYESSGNADLINSTLDDCKASSDTFGEYIREGKNKKFKGEKWTIEYSENTLLEVQAQVTQSIESLKKINVKDSKSKRAFKKYISQSQSLLKFIDKEIAFLSNK